MYEKVGLKCRLKRIQLHRLENVGLKTFFESSQPDVPECFEIPRFGCLPKPLQKRTVWWSFWILLCVLWGGVRKVSNVRKCRFKHIQLYRLENVGLKVFLTSSWNPKVWMPSQTIAKTDDLVVVLDTFLCIVGWGTQSFKRTEMSI